MSASFEYQRHLTEGDEIRLISLQPGQKNDPLKATIQYRSLSDKPSYQTLSYTWGSPFNTDHPSWPEYKSFKSQQDFHIDNGLIEITHNLYKALLQIRKIDDSIELWVDAVCIDQSHDVEKSWQIQKMREIYEKASQVLLWLGPKDETSDLAMRALEAGYRYYLKTSPHVKLGSIRHTPAVASSEQEFEDQLVAASLGQLFGMKIDSDVPIPEYPIKAVANLLNRAYWGRGWCWQEFTVATKLSILCGEHVSEEGDMCIQVFFETWDTLVGNLGRQPYALDHRPWSVMDLRRSYRNLVYLKEVGFLDDGKKYGSFEMPFKIWGFQNPRLTDEGKSNLYREAVGKLSLKAMLRESSISWLQTNKDHREDQVYALLGIATDEAQLGITVDCALPWEEVYTQVAVTYLKQKDLWFLTHCQSGVAGLRARSPRLPSWVPDWSEGYRSVIIVQHYSPRGHHLGLLEPFNPPDLQRIKKHNRLQLRGMIVDEIVWHSTERYALPVNDLATPGRTALLEWIRILYSQCTEFTRRDLWTVLIAGSTRLPMPDEYQKAGNVSEERLREYIDTAFGAILMDREQFSGPTLKVIIEGFLRCFMQATAWRCVIKTKDGRLGLAHAGIQEGDRIAVFMGSESAFVVRPVALTSERKRYRVLCECFVLGLMEDEGLKAEAVVDDVILE